MTEELQNTIENTPSKIVHGVKTGGIVGGVMVVISLLLYIVNPSTFAASWLNLSLLVLSFGIVIYFGLQFRKLVGGYLSFGDAFVHGFISFLIAGFMGTLFNILLFNVIDPDLARLIMDTTIDNTIALFEKLGMTGSQIDETVEKMEKDMIDGFKPLGAIKNYLIVSIFYVIAALISGAIVKKKKPEEKF